MALRLIPLSQDTLSIAQEIRIWRGMGLGVPYDLLRLVRRNGKVEGRYSWWWPVFPRELIARLETTPIDAVLRYGREGQCSRPRRVGAAEGCDLYLLTKPDWQVMWDSLTALGVWTLPDQSALPRDSVLVFDGSSMTVEVRDGRRYRSYAYNNPDVHAHPAQHLAAAIERIDFRLDLSTPRPKQERTVEGKLDVRHNDVSFTPCRSNRTIGATGGFSPIVHSAMTRAGKDSTYHAVFFVRMRGMLAYPGLAKEWRSPYPDVFESDTVLQATEWGQHRC